MRESCKDASQQFHLRASAREAARLALLKQGVKTELKASLAEISQCKGDASPSSCSGKWELGAHPLPLPSHVPVGTKRGRQLEMPPNSSSVGSCRGWALQPLGDGCATLLGLLLEGGELSRLASFPVLPHLPPALLSSLPKAFLCFIQTCLLWTVLLLLSHYCLSCRTCPVFGSSR